MKGACPNKNLPEWINTQNILGEDNTWKVWIATKDGVLPEPIKSAFYLYTQDNLVDAANLFESYIPTHLKIQFNDATTLLDMINSALDNMFTKDSFKQWLAENELFDKLFEGETIKRTEEEKEVISNKDQTLIELANEKISPDAFIKPIDPVALHNKFLTSQIAYDYAQKFSVKFATISIEEAREMLDGTVTPYNYEVVTHNAGTNYYIQDNLSTNTRFADIALPAIQGLRKGNPISYNQFLERLYATSTGSDIMDQIEKDNPGLSILSDVFKDKLMVAALIKDSINQSITKSGKENIDSADATFNEVVNDIMGSLRGSLRKTFGRSTTLFKLKTNSNLIETANLLLEKHKDIEELTPKDIVKSNTELQDSVDDILKAINNDPTKKEIDNVINNVISIIESQIKEVRSKEFKGIRKELSDESGGFLRDISDRLRAFRKNANPEKLKQVENLDLSYKARQLVNSLITLEKALVKVNEYMSKVNSSSEDPYNKLIEVNNYNKLLDQWSSLIYSTSDNLRQVGIPSNSSLRGLVGRLEGSVTDSKRLFNTIQEKASVYHVTKSLQERSQPILNNIDKEIEKLQSKSGNDSHRAKLIKDLKEKKDKYTFTESKVKSYFSGQLGDSDFLSSLFESYSTNPDPILADFALFLKSTLNKVTTDSFTKSKEFMEGTQDLRKNLGITNSNYQKEWSEYLSTDERAIKGEDGKVTSEPVLSFMSPVTNYRVPIARLNEAIREAKDSNNREAIIKAYKEKEDHDQKYMNREMKKEYYDAQKGLLTTNPEAFHTLEDINREIWEAEKSSDLDSVETYEKYQEIKILKDKKRALASEFNDDGTLKDEKGRKMAQDISEHNSKMSKFYESIEIPGKFQRTFEGFINYALSPNYYPEMDKMNKDTGEFSADFLDLINKWLKQNTNKRYTDEYYTRLADIFKQLEEASKGLPEEYNIAELQKKKTRLLSRYKDQDGQTNPSLMKENRENLIAQVKEIQQQIVNIQDKLRQDKIRVSADTKIKISQALKLLSELRHNEPTTHYLDEINEYMGAMNQPNLDEFSAIGFLKDLSLINELRKNPNFRNWFDKNHITNEYLDRGGEIRQSYQRLDAWSIAIPNANDYGESKYLKTTSVTYNGQEYSVTGVPNNNYSFSRVKNEYMTIPLGETPEESQKIRESMIGTVIDNHNQFLPLSREQFLAQGRPVEDKYINAAYYDLIQNRDKKELLDKVKSYHLENQKGLVRDQKLYLDLPRFAISSNIEMVQRGMVPRWVDRIKGITKGAVASLKGLGQEEANKASQTETDEVGEFSNPEAEQASQEITAITDGVLLGKTTDRIPLRGVNKVPIEKVSYDVLASLNLYGLQAEKQRVLNEINPLAQAIKKTLENFDKGVSQYNGIVQKEGENNFFFKFGKGVTKKGTDNRVKAFNALYNREFKGQLYSDKHLDWVNKLTSTLTTGASINFFALNLPSAVKNYWGILWQMNIEAVAGEYFDFKSMGKGKVRSKVAMHEWSTRIWGGTFNTLNTQLIMNFDPIQGKAEESLGKDNSRTFAKDLVSLSWIYSPRKYMEMEGGLQLFFSMMYHKKVERTINGNTSLIPYAEAFELDKDGKMTLLDGIDKEWDVNGKEFNNFQNAVHEKSKDLNGVFAKFEQPQAQAYFAYRLFAFMRRYFTSMFMNRFGSERANFALGTVRTGYYIEAIKSIARILQTFGAHARTLSPNEKRSLLKITADIAQMVIIAGVASLLFGFDDDDEDRYVKLRAKSGALGSDDFNTVGWLSNHVLTLLLKTRAENDSFIPLPGLGLHNYESLASTTSIAFGPTITAYAKIITDLAGHAAPGENDNLYYKRDTGPYPWQKEDEAKIWNHIGTMLGFSGSQVDPIKGLESFKVHQNG